MTEQTQPGGQLPRTASEILSAAETLAEEIRERARADADAIRAHAGSESADARSTIQERVRRLSEITAGMLEQLGEMRVELDELSASLEDSPAPAPAPAPARAPAPGASSAAAAVSEDPPPAAAVRPPEDASTASVDDAGARLIALNLALSDTPRDEAARQLRDQVPDPERLVDEVYASVDR